MVNASSPGLKYLWSEMPGYLRRNLAYEGVIVGGYLGSYEYFNEDLKKATIVLLGLMALRLTLLNAYNGYHNCTEDEASKKKKVDPIHWFEFLFFLAFGLLSIWKDEERFLKLQPAIIAAGFGLSILISPLITGEPFLKTMLGKLLSKYYPQHAQKIDGIQDKEWKNVGYALAANFLLTAAILVVFGKFCPDDLWIYLKYPLVFAANAPGTLYGYRVIKPHLAGEINTTPNDSSPNRLVSSGQ